jgi:hypothetical protein
LHSLNIKTLKIRLHKYQEPAYIDNWSKKSARPLHARIFVHPTTAWLLLCIGVLLAGLTFRVYSDSYTVTAEVPAPIPPAATIISPADQTHFTTNPVTVSGDCTANTYVELLDNNTISGVANCGNGQTIYSLSIDLVYGSNVLVAQVYNITNQAGPPSSSITLWLDHSITPPPTSTTSTTPAILAVISQDNVPFKPGVIAHVSPYVTERGIAPPNALVTITFHSPSIPCRTYANASGVWSCTLDQPLANGYHVVYVSAVTPSGELLTLPSFQIYVTAQVAPLQPSTPAGPFLITTNYIYRVLASGQIFTLPLIIENGTAPYAVTVVWGDGTTSTIARSTTGTFSALHVYRLTDARQRLYTVKVQASDSTGTTDILQLPEIVRNNNFTLPIIGPVKTNNLLDVLTRFFWPVYLVLILMAISFWLGEREEYYIILKRRHNSRHNA